MLDVGATQRGGEAAAGSAVSGDPSPATRGTGQQ